MKSVILLATLFLVQAQKETLEAQPAANPVQFVHVTPHYSNAVLQALFPHFNNFVGKLKDVIPELPNPIVPAMVKSFKPNPTAGYVGGWLVLTNGFQFWFANGVVDSFQTPRDYIMIESLDMAPRFYGTLRMSRDEAVTLSKQTIEKLGYRVEDVCHDWPLKIWGPGKQGTNVIPFYEVKWEDPKTDFTTRFDIDGERRKIAGMFLSTDKIRKRNPRVSVVPELELDFRKRMKNSARPLTGTNGPPTLSRPLAKQP